MTSIVETISKKRVKQSPEYGNCINTIFFIDKMHLFPCQLFVLFITRQHGLPIASGHHGLPCVEFYYVTSFLSVGIRNF